MSWLYDKLQEYREACMGAAIAGIFAISTIGALSGKNEPIIPPKPAAEKPKPAMPLEECVAKEEKKIKKLSPIEEALLKGPPKEIDWEQICKTMVKLYDSPNGTVSLLTAGRTAPIWSNDVPLTPDDENALKRLMDLYASGSRTKRHILENGMEIAHYMINDEGQVFFIHDYQNKTAYYPVKQKKQIKASSALPRKP